MDPRRLKSRQKLKDGLLSLLDQKPLNQISIEEISAKSGVSRPTFYSNFNNSSEIIKELIDQSFASYKELLDQRFVLENTSSGDLLRSYFAYLFELILADKKLLSIALSGRAGCDALTVAHEHIVAMLPSAVLSGEAFSDTDPRHVYLSCGFCGIVKFICENKFRLTADEMADHALIFVKIGHHAEH